MLAQEILLKAKKNVFTNRAADNLSRMRGEGMDFREIRPYQPGDDVRKINFCASSKTGELQTNVFNENKQLNIIISVVLLGSLYFGSVRLKSTLIAEVIAHLGYSSLQQKNKTKVVFFSSDLPKIFHLNCSGDLLKAIEYMLEFDLLKSCKSHGLNDYLIQQKKSLVFLLSDFYQTFDGALISHKNQINALIMRDKLEEYPEFNAPLSLINAQSGSSTEINISKKLAKNYKKILEKQDNKLYLHAQKHKINIGKIYTCDDVFFKLLQILK